MEEKTKHNQGIFTCLKHEVKLLHNPKFTYNEKVSYYLSFVPADRPLSQTISAWRKLIAAPSTHPLWATDDTVARPQGPIVVLTGVGHGPPWNVVRIAETGITSSTRHRAIGTTQKWPINKKL
jgi:hypothetical protein